MMDAIIKIGVKDYHLVTQGSCGHLLCPTSIKISLQLEGDFLGAAQSDELNQTVDYDSLCQNLSSIVLSLPPPSLSDLKAAILAFSTLISGGYVELELSCPHIFLKDRCLL